MELVKRVDVTLDALDKLVFTENPEGNTAIYRGKVTKEEFPRVTSFCEFIQHGCPPEFVMSHFIWEKKKAEIDLYYNENIKFKFKVELNDKGIFGNFQLEKNNNRWQAREYQIFFYHWDSEINSMKLFQNIFSQIDFFAEDDKPLKLLRKIYPDAEDIYFNNYSYYYEEYIVKFGSKDSEKERNFVFSFDKKNITFKLLGYLAYGDYGSNLCTIEHLKETISHAQNSIEDLEAMQEILDTPIKKSEETSPYEEGRLREAKKLEANKADLPRLKARDRNPELVKFSTHQLLSWLNAYRKSDNGYNHVPYSKDDLKTELLYRPHYPKGQAGKEYRRKLSQGKIQKKE